MTHIKHIIIFVIMLIALGHTAKAQSSTRTPKEGALVTYTCNGISVGAGYTFYITANADGSGLYDDGLTSEFDIINATGTVGGDGLASTPIQWNIGASQHIYYLWMEAAISGGCSNNINIQISPQPGFDLLSENMPVGNTTSCPDITSVSFNPLATAYNAGASTLRFKVKREFGTVNTVTSAPYNWSFIPELEVLDFVAGLNNVIIKVEGSSGEILAVGNRYSVSGFDDEVIVTVSIDNAPGTIRDVTLKVTLGLEDTTNLSDNNQSNNNVTHTIHVMPLIGGMGGV